MSRQLATRARMQSNGRSADEVADRIEEQARLGEQYVQVIEELLERMPSPGDQAGPVRPNLDESKRTA